MIILQLVLTLTHLPGHVQIAYRFSFRFFSVFLLHIFGLNFHLHFFSGLLFIFIEVGRCKVQDLFHKIIVVFTFQLIVLGFDLTVFSVHFIDPDRVEAD